MALKDPSSIVLGPPKTSFASSSARSPGNPFGSPGRSAFGSFGGETSRGDYFGRGKLNGDREGKDDTTKDGRNITSRGGRDHNGQWSGPRSARGFGEKEGKHPHREGERDNETDHGEGREGRRFPLRVPESYRPANHRDGEDARRHESGRGSKPAWFLDGETSEPPSRGEGNRSRDWRDNGRARRPGSDFEWGREARNEQDPEWMMDTKPEEKKEKHTAQDIEQWKASMKAQALEGQGNSMAASQSSQEPAPSATTGGRSRPGPSLTLDQGVDSFFNAWGGAHPSNNLRVSDNGLHSDNARVAPPKSSRFTDFFSPQPAVTPSNPEPPALPSQPAQPKLQDTSNEDAAGLQRILKQLYSQQVPDTPDASANGTETAPPEGRQTPPREYQATNQPQSPPIISPQSRKSHHLNNILGMQSPSEAPRTMNRDSEYLLNLIRRDPELQNVLPLQHHPSSGEPTNILPHLGGMRQPQMTHGAPDDGNMRQPFYDDRREPHRGFDKLNPNASGNHTQRGRPSFDKPDDGNAFHAPNHSGMPMGMLPPPPGLARPMHNSGSFSQFVPYQQQQQQPQQPHPPQGGRMVGPPPGFANHPSQRPHQFPPGLPPIGGLNLGNDRSPYGMPAMGPPPGGPDSGPGGNQPFMGGPPPPMGNGLPHHFPPHAAFSPMGVGAGGGPFGPGSGARPPGPPSPPGHGDAFGDFGGLGRGHAGGAPGHLGRRPD